MTWRDSRTMQTLKTSYFLKKPTWNKWKNKPRQTKNPKQKEKPYSALSILKTTFLRRQLQPSPLLAAQPRAAGTSPHTPATCPSTAPLHAPFNLTPSLEHPEFSHPKLGSSGWGSIAARHSWDVGRRWWQARHQLCCMQVVSLRLCSRSPPQTWKNKCIEVSEGSL